MASTIRLAAVVLSYNTLTQNQFSRVPRDRELGYCVAEENEDQYLEEHRNSHHDKPQLRFDAARPL
jgi:hypothetical protein